MYQTSIQKVKGSIFPIFHIGPKGFGVVGTGFFISDQGHFLTAAHVIRALPPNSKFGYAGNVPYTKETDGEFLPIEIIQNDPQLDLALCHVKHGALPPLNLAPSRATLGQSVILCGYPLAMVRPQTVLSHANQATNVLDITHVRQYWQPTVLIDSLPKGVLMNKPFHSFLTQDASLNGMSGAPIFNLDGEVVGLASANLTRQIPRPNGITLTIENGVGIDLVEIHAFLPKVLGPALVTVP
jgi:serine protease Do